MTQYYVDFSGWTKEEVLKWLKENSKPFIEEYNGWNQETTINNVFNKYPNDPALSFKDETLKVYIGYANSKWYKNNNYIKVNTKKIITIRDFFDGKPITLKNDETLTMLKILCKPDSFWDGCHDFIQWLLPTATKSNYNSNAPVLTKEDAIYIRDNHTDLYKAIMSRFYNYIAQTDMDTLNHNHLRMTRMIESTMLILYPDRAVIDYQIDQFFEMCAQFLPDGRDSYTTLVHWTKALGAKFPE